jgi:hypothetical protein
MRISQFFEKLAMIPKQFEASKGDFDGAWTGKEVQLSECWSNALELSVSNLVWLAKKGRTKPGPEKNLRAACPHQVVRGPDDSLHTVVMSKDCSRHRFDHCLPSSRKRYDAS